MRRKFLLVGVGLLLLLGIGVQLRSASNMDAAEFRTIPLRKPVEGAPLCPWRQPTQDLRDFYPHATDYKTETAILSSALIQLKTRLGRLPQPEENPLYLHHIYAGSKLIGTVLVRRVKGEYGAIELVLAVNREGTVRGLKLQRLREPEPIARALTATRWINAFKGQSLRSQWQLGQSIPDVSPAARQSAQAVAEGVRSSLILLQTARELAPLSSSPSHLSGRPHH